MQKLFLTVLFLLLSIVLNASEKESVSIQLKWKHSFQFAGYYAAIEKGFYADEGLEVRLQERDAGKNYLQAVINGESEYGVSDSSLIVERLQKNPVVLITQIFQYSPLVLISHKESNITTPYEMIGKKLMYSVNGTGDTPFKALILKTIGSFDKIITSEFTSYQDFIDKKVDVTSAYATSQPYWLKKQGIEVNIIDPKSYGINFYGDNLFSTQKELDKHPLRVEKMRRATLKGWKYALSHQDELIDIILQKYAPSKHRDFLEFEARGIYQMIMPDLTDLGTFSKDRYAQVAKTYYQLGIVESDKIPEDFFYKKRQKELNLTVEEKKWIQQHPIVTVGGGPDWAPFDFVNSKGIYTGIANDYLNLISQKTGLKFNVKVDKWSNNLQKMRDQKIDLLHALYYTDERSKYMTYTKPYFEMLDYFFIRSDLNVTTLKDLNGKRIAMPKEYAHADTLRKEFPYIKIVTVDTFSEAIDAVLENRADALFDTYAALSYVLKKNSITTIIPFKSYRGHSNANLYMATNKKNPILASIIDKGLAKITKQEKNTIYNRWLWSDKNEKIIDLSQEERDWLSKNPTVTFAGDPNWLPFEAFDDNGKYIGIVADYLKNIEQLTDIKFKPIQTSDWSHTIAHAQKGDIDVISDDIHSKPPQKYYKPIPTYIKSPIVIVMKSSHNFVSDIKDIDNKKIALIVDYGFNDKIKSAYPNQKFIYMKNADIALQLLSSGKIDAVLLTMPKASYLLSTGGYTNLKIVGKTTVNLSLTLFIHKNKPELFSIIQKSMQKLSSTKSLEILGKWQKVEFAKKTDYMLLFQIAGILGLFLLGTLYWNRKLSKEVKKREEVQQALALAKEEAEHANLAKSEFLANMSHEIRTPMNSVMGFSELLAKQITDPIQKDYLDSIQRGGYTLLNIINDILDLSKIEAGKLEIVLESVDIKQLALEMESIFSVKLIQKNIHFELDIDPSLPKYLLLDNTRIRQILFNLIGNAIKFTHHGSVKLSVKKILEDEEKSKIDLQISVEDSGIGIPKENLSAIFDTFEQQKGQDSQKYGGTGLGLAISKRLINMMGGTINVESEVDVGSKFTIELPNIPISSIESEKMQKTATIKNIQFEKATILIVDDIKDNRKLVSSSLLEYDLEVIEAQNGKDAIELLENIKIDLIFMDIKMPIMNGYEAAKIIKEDKRLKNIPLIALTASVMGRDLQRIKEYKFDGYLRKPVSQEDLITQIGKFLKHKTLEILTEEKQKIDSSTYINLPEVINTLENEYTKTWENIKEMGDFTLIANFADSLENLGDKNSIHTLSNYAKELKINCESYDIERVDFMMNSYPQLIEKLRGLIG